MYQNEATQASSQKYLQISLIMTAQNFFCIQPKVMKLSRNISQEVLSHITLIIFLQEAHIFF